MNTPNIYLQAKKNSEDFFNKDVLNYSRLRNFDFGINKRNNVSNLSKFISHRIIYEYDLIRKLLNLHNLELVEKFVQEVFWRIYWKGWLEKRPEVWDDFKKDINLFKSNKNLQNALDGKTNINCFNQWVYELKKYNHLHNHTRMWFASIWIFTLKLPWQLGAKFFIEHLLDGDAASNTLSWRWVAGLQTKGKNYLAKTWNIQKFTNNRFIPENLANKSLAIIDNREYKISENSKYNFAKINHHLILFENDLYYEDRNEIFIKYDKIYVILLDNTQREIELSENVLNFKKKLIESFNLKYTNSEVINAFKLIKKLNGCSSIDVIYPFIGENLDFLKKFSKDSGIKINFLYRKEDIYCWKFSKKGFFNFKKNIPEIIDELILK